MTFDEAIALQPVWLGYWLNWLLFGAFILPLALVIWRQSRIVGIVTIVASALAAAGVMWMFDKMGYVKLLGLPHIIFWTPLVIYQFSQIKRPDMPVWPKRILWVVMLTIIVSLLFDYADAVRYLLGEREPFAG